MEKNESKWAELLHKAVTVPGLISEAYQRFHEYSIGNQILAMTQCADRSLQPGPLATFQGWKEKNRFVKKGEKALTLCMPITYKKDKDNPDSDERIVRFTYKNCWFVLSQTEGEEYTPPPIPNWDKAQALQQLDLQEVEYSRVSGNMQGYAKERHIAINPLAEMPHKTRFHEMAHVLLGHTAERMTDGGERTPRDLRELEAEAVALLCCASLGLHGEEFSRGYIQNWYHENTVPEQSAQRIFRTANCILKAGLPQKSEQPGFSHEL